MSSTIEGIFHSSIRSRRHDRLTNAAEVIASLHPYAVDYIQQAPVLVLKATLKDPLKYREQIEKEWAPLLEARPKLRELMEHFKLAYQLRQLYGCVLQPRHWKTLVLISKINPSTLAQSIPARIGRQKSWLSNLYRWNHQFQHHERDPLTHLEWAVCEFAQAGSLVVTDIADFAARSDQFNPSWGLVQARTAAQRWHQELARANNTERHQHEFGIDWTAPVDYGKLPLTLTVDRYQFVALRSGEDLFNEGRVMHNCVGIYFSAVQRGMCRIYSIRRNGEPVATLELGYSTTTNTILGVRQCKGPCNAPVDETTLRVVTKFVKKARIALSAD